MSIKDWGTVEKIQRKVKKLIVLCNIYWNFEKKITGVFGKNSGEFWKSLRKLGKFELNLCKFYKRLIQILYLLFRKMLKCLIIWWNSDRCWKRLQQIFINLYNL